MSDAIATPTAAPVNAPAAAPAQADAPILPGQPPPEPSSGAANQASKRRSIAEKRRENPNHDAQVWERAKAKAAAKEAAKEASAAPAADGTPAKDPATGKFLPRGAKAKPAHAAAPASDDSADGSVIDDKGSTNEVSTSAPAAPPAAPSADDRAAKRAQLEALATELGFKFDAKAVTAADRYSLREEARRRQETFQRQMAEERAAFEKERGSFGEEAKSAKAFKAAFEAGDYDGLAAAVGAKDWNDLQEKVLERISDPHYAEIKRLREELESDKRAKAEAAEKEKATAEQRRQHELVHGAKVAISQEAAKSTDKLLAALHWDPLLVDSLYDLQARHYDHITQTTIPLEEALDVDLGGGRTVRAHLKRQYESLHKAFGPQAAPLPPPRPVVPAAAPAPVKPKPAPAPRRQPEAPVRTTVAERIRARKERDDEVIRRYSQPLT